MTIRLVMMGVSGCGKSTLGRALAETCDLPFFEGDDCHPPANIAKMAAGIPLTDEDRAPFLDAVAAALASTPAGAVAACSALKRIYRDRIRAVVPDVGFVLPVIDGAALYARLAGRTGHFMPPSLLASQMDTLELPGADEAALLLDGGEPLGTQVERVLSFIDSGASAPECARSH